jgi:DNA mismatch repair protein MSH6
VQGGENGVSPMLMSLLEILQSSSSRMFHVETIRSQETFPKSTAIDKDIQRRLERSGNSVHPWQVKETLEEIHRRRYYPRASMKDDSFNVSRWPPVIRACVEGNAELALSSFGAVLFYLQRSLIDHELLSMGIVKAYIPPATSAGQDENDSPIARLAIASTRAESAVDETIGLSQTQDVQSIYRQTQLSQPPMDVDGYPNSFSEDEIDHLSLDGTTLKNLEILVNSVDLKPAGSLWWLINHTKAPHGARLLRAWLLRPLFRKAQIDRRTDAVEELVSGAAAFAFDESRSVLAKCGDIERLLSRVHSMSGMTSESDDAHASIHPSDRAVLYENVTYTKRKVADFSKLLNGLRSATRIPEIFQDIEIRSGLLTKIVTLHSKGGSFPDMENEVDWYFANFDCDKAAKGEFEPVRGIDALYDEACVEIERIESVGLLIINCKIETCVLI